jgi:ubiquinone/menaquinone biosynthesis C-methylase UbiE
MRIALPAATRGPQRRTLSRLLRAMPPLARRRSRQVEQYWTDHTVRVESFATAEDSEAHLEWRFSQYPLFRELSGLWGDHRGETVLDYGCGPGNDVVGLLLHSGAAKVIGLDVSPTSIRLAAKRVALHALPETRAELVEISEGARRLPLEDRSIDHVNCQGVLHHVSDPERVLREFRRVLRPSGRAAVMVYNRDSIYFHVYTAYLRTIVEGAFAGKSIEEAFQANTDGPACPISRAYRPAEFAALCEGAGFDASYRGGYFHRKEPRWLREHRAGALASAELAEEHKRFIREVTWDQEGLPLVGGKHCGIGGVYHLRPL